MISEKLLSNTSNSVGYEIRLSFYPTNFQIFIYIPDGPNESECSEDLDLEAIIGKKIHQWKKSEI